MSAAAGLIKEHRDKVMQEWMQQAGKKVLAAGITNSLALRDHLPSLLDYIALILEDEPDWSSESLKASPHYQDVGNSSSEHGRHRASTQAYSVEQILHEYIILHEITAKLLVDHELNSPDVLSTVSFTFEHAMQKAVLSFSTSIDELHEKLIATFVHDLRNPIANAQLAASLLENTLPDAKGEKLVGMIKISLEKSLAMINELTELVTAQAGAGLMVYFENSDYCIPLKSVHEDSEHMYSQPITINCPSGKVEGIMDETAIRRMMENLVTNGVKYSQGRGQIELGLTDKHDEIEYKLVTKEWQLSEEKVSEINEFFKGYITAQQAKHSDLGNWGMNLAMVKAVADAHKGIVECNSHEDGTQFIITLSKKPSKAGKVRTSLSQPAGNHTKQ